MLIAKVGLDGHDRGARVIARLLQEDGFEVVYVGIRHTPAEVAQVAALRDVDVVGLSILSGAHVDLCAAVRQKLDALGCGHVPIILGGLIPHRDGAVLKAAGAERVLHPGDALTDVSEIAEIVDDLVDRSRNRAAMRSGDLALEE